MTMSRLIYHSEVRELGHGGVQSILDVSRANNKRTGLTGVLVFNRNYFLQLLEGSRIDVTTRFCKIAADPRHGVVTLVSVHDTDIRDFADWTMGYISSTSPELNLLLHEFLPTAEFTPPLLSADSTVALLKRIRGMDSTV
jgi:FAD-dependent sensor of blue light